VIKTWVKFKLEVASILHIGSGEKGEVEQNTKDSEDIPTTSQLSRIVRDSRGLPWIPGSTLKGALRKAEPKLATKLFGAPHKGTASTGAGRVLVFGASTQIAPVFVLRRTKIHDGTGVAEANKLFAKEYVETGAIFDVEMCIRVLAGDDLRQLKDDLLKVLRHFAGDEGLEIASGKSDSLGRLKLVGDVVDLISEKLSLERGLEPVGTTETLKVEAINRYAEVLHLHCRGPFLIQDQTRPSGKKDKNGKELTNHLMPLVSGSKPRLLETSVSGALRKRAAWLVELDPAKNQPASVQTTTGRQNLTTIKRLFGDEGYRAKLKVMIKSLSHSKQTSEFPSVKLNPLTQGTVPGALFVVNAHHGLGFDLHYTSRSSFADDERALLDALIADIRNNGIQIGFGGSKGFGWFEENKRSRPGLNAVPEAIYRDALDTQTLNRLPDKRVTLPYRTVEVDPEKILLPEPCIEKAFIGKLLHSKPIDAAFTGHIDVSWLFDTPMLVGGAQSKGVSGPIRMGEEFILPGTTLRGYIRSYLASLCNSRLQALPDVVPRYVDRDRQLQKLIETWRDNKQHNPTKDETYVPDFVEALFGFSQEPEVDSAMTPSKHDRLLLKSRLSFEPAYLENEPDQEQGKETYTMVLGGPTGESRIYDAIARKVYPAERVSARQVQNRFRSPVDRGNNDAATTLRFLHPQQAGTGDDVVEPLHFRGRIHFHNVTPTELGALIFAITLGARRHARHRIGHAKAFGAGQARVAPIRVELKYGKKPDMLVGDCFASFVEKLQELDSKHGKSQTYDEVLAADLPAYGSAVKTQNENDRKRGYQTWSTVENGGRVVVSGLDQFSRDARDNNGGRIAAALKPHPDRKKKV
jgi:CRISPR/Cas system CSM-associated protein Csm3 (group 7 of RAMP superfamily)